jgi:hypothetical protein
MASADPVSLPKDKWICPDHYIHVFYDDEDKGRHKHKTN